jgi:hypothetical protein
MRKALVALATLACLVARQRGRAMLRRRAAYRALRQGMPRL